MRLAIPAAAMMLLAAQLQPGFAQTTPAPVPAAPAAVAPVPAAPAAAAAPSPTTPAEITAPKPVKPAAKKHIRMTLQQRFDGANVTHDGKLTKPQAIAAKWPYVMKNFDAIDADQSGSVTMAEIHTFALKQRAARKAVNPAPAATAPATN